MLLINHAESSSHCCLQPVSHPPLKIFLMMLGNRSNPLPRNPLQLSCHDIVIVKVVDNQIFWTEGRPLEGGSRTILVHYDKNASSAIQREAISELWHCMSKAEEYRALERLAMRCNLSLLLRNHTIASYNLSF